MIRYFSFISFCLLCLIFSCVDSDEGPVSFRENQFNRLISGDSSKTWRLMLRSIDGVQEDLEECELDDNILIELSQDTLLIRFLQGEFECPQVSDDMIISIDTAVALNMLDTIQVFSEIDSIVVINLDSIVVDGMDTSIFTITDSVEVEPMVSTNFFGPIVTINRDTAFFVQFGSLSPVLRNQLFQDTVEFRRFRQEGLTGVTDIIIDLLTSESLNWIILSDSGAVREEYQFIEGL